MFRDTSPYHRMPEPTRAEIKAGEDAYYREQVAKRAAVALALTDSIGALLDRHEERWRDDDAPLVEQIAELLTEAQAIAERLS